jgi:hypothetical protein
MLAMISDDIMAIKPSGDGSCVFDSNVFISYSRKDAEFVDRLEKDLIRRGFALTIDRSDIYAFEDWWRRIEELIVKADTIIFVLSPDAASSDICRKEVNSLPRFKSALPPLFVEALMTSLSLKPFRGSILFS